jgi:hypothetical protein
VGLAIAPAAQGGPLGSGSDAQPTGPRDPPSRPRAPEPAPRQVGRKHDRDDSRICGKLGGARDDLEICLSLDKLRAGGGEGRSELAIGRTNTVRTYRNS